MGYGVKQSKTIWGSDSAITTSWTDIWVQNIVRTNPAVAVQIGVSSGNANDTSAGSGARTVKLEGVDANYAPLSETITMNGQTKVVSVGTYLFVTAGSGLVNAGEIYAYDTSDSVVSGVPQTATKIFERIATGLNQSLSAHYTTSNVERLRLNHVEAALADDTATAKYGKVRCYVLTAGSVPIYYMLGGIGSPAALLECEPVIEIPPKTLIVFQGKVSAAGGEAMIMADFEAIPQRFDGTY